jgi:lipopolysaccharide export system permease protein
MKLLPSLRLIRYLLLEVIPLVILALSILTLLILAQQISRQSDLLFNSVISATLILRLILYLLPGVLVITLPFSLLIGSLIALNRLSADNEIVAARATGISLWKLALPFVICGSLGTIFSACLTIQVLPQLVTTAKSLRAEALLTILAAPIKEQTFNTQFANHLVYARDIDKTTGEWVGVFILRQASSEQSLILTAQRGQLRITKNHPLALEIELSDGLLFTVFTNEPEKQTLTSFQQQKIKLSVETPAIAEAIAKAPTPQELSLSQLSHQSRTAELPHDRRQADVEWHKRFSLPFACLILTLLAIPLGLRPSRQAGRAVAFATGFMIAMLYYLTLLAGQNLALSGTIPVVLGIWLPNLLGTGFALAQSLFTANNTTQLRKTSSRPIISIKHLLNPILPKFSPVTHRRPLLLSLVNYLTASELVKYFTLAVAILVSTSIIFTLFDLLPSLSRSGLGWKFAGVYLVFLGPQVLYYITPFAFLIAALTTHGILSRSNQLTALLTTGQSPLRLSIPLICCIIATIAGLLWLSEQILPQANREQDARYNRIKGKKSEQAIFSMGRYWVQGEDETIYGFQINNTDNSLLNTTVYRTNLQTGRLLEITQLREAPNIDAQTWHIKQGWRYTISPSYQLDYDTLPLSIASNHAANYLIVREGVPIFRRIVNEASKMSFQELREHVRYLSRVGTATAPLRVELEKKIAFPFSCIPLLILAIPITLRNTRRSTLAGIGFSIMIGFTYWITANFFEGLGRQSYLPPGLSVWGPQALFATLGVFLGFRLRK